MLIGRDKEVERIAALVAAAREGRSGALVVRGEPGIGKTALLEHARSLAGDDMLVLEARGIEAESELPFSGLGDIAGPLLHLRPQLPPVQALALGQALALEDSGTPPRFAVPAALLGLLGTAAEERPLLVLVDDAQWLDAPSVEAVVFAARRLRDEGVALVLTIRDATPGLDVDTSGLDVVRPEPLSDREAATLLRQAHGDRVRGTVAADVATAASGNPLALLELPTALSDAQLAGREALPPVLPPGETVAYSFRRRLGELPESARQALLVAAAGQDEDLTELTHAMDRLGLEEGALDPAEAAGMVAIEGGRVRFRHPLVRSAAYHLASAPARRAAHRALAEGARDGAPSRAWHLAAAAVSADEGVAQDLEAAANDARRRGGHGSAARAFARSAEMTPEAGERARRLMEAAVESQIAGELDRAQALCDEGLALDGDPVIAALLHRVRAGVRIRAGHPIDGLAEMVEASAAIEPAVPVAAAAMLLEASLGQLASGPIVDTVWMADRARVLAGDDPALGALADTVIGEALMATGEPTGGEEHLARSAPVLLEVEPPPGAWDVVALNAHGSMWLEQMERAERVVAHVIDRGRADGALGQLAYPLSIRAQLRFRQGRWPEALADADEAERASADTGQETMLALALCVRTHIEAGLGNGDDARAFAERVRELLARNATFTFTPYLQAGLGVLALSEGDHELAARELLAGIEAAERIGFTMPGQEVLSPDVVEALCGAGDAEGAQAAYDRLARHLSEDQPPTVRAQFARARAFLARDAEATAAFEEALELHAQGDNTFEEARTRLACGERLRHAGRDALEPAQEQLGLALETFERLGAKAWAARTSAELEATGVARKHEPAAIAELLTPHELQVAMVVAGGATNKEAAAALFLSPKTVEHHLGQIYKKLSLSSRTELTALLT
jgi:DNA-binding NarL/FixJ family response regulator